MEALGNGKEQLQICSTNISKMVIFYFNDLISKLTCASLTILLMGSRFITKLIKSV